MTDFRAADYEASMIAQTEAARMPDTGACGFAWVEYFPAHKGNTKLGRAERKLVESAGYSKDHTGKAWVKWNPGKYHGQSVAAVYAGASAYVKSMHGSGQTELNGKFYAADRLD